MKDEKVKLFLVDDDALYLKLLEIEFLANESISVETFATGELCIQNLSLNPDVVILDYLLDGVVKTAMNGLATLDKIKAFDPKIPVIILSEQDKIDVAVNCMHHKATDYVVKSETAFLRLQSIITRIVRYKKMEAELTWYIDRM
jgi:two-component system OmpR family response regulator